jgi:hypothetical protein
MNERDQNTQRKSNLTETNYTGRERERKRKMHEI